MHYHFLRYKLYISAAYNKKKHKYKHYYLTVYRYCYKTDVIKHIKMHLKSILGIGKVGLQVVVEHFKIQPKPKYNDKSIFLFWQLFRYSVPDLYPKL